LDGDNKNMFFSGDTNLKKGKDHYMTEAFKKVELKPIINKLITSIGSKNPHKIIHIKKDTRYSQPYDKFYARSNFEILKKDELNFPYLVSNIKKYKILETTFSKDYQGYNFNERHYQRIISDHDCIYIDIKIK
jgi:hypothetical protein